MGGLMEIPLTGPSSEEAAHARELLDGLGDALYGLTRPADDQATRRRA
jgi:hypothetical protein